MSDLRLAVIALAVGALAVGCGASEPGGVPTVSLTAVPSPPSPAPANTGVRLTTVMAPTCPVERVGQTCAAPTSVAVIITWPRGALTVHTDASGHATVALAPGLYTVSGAPNASHQGFPRPPAPVEVTVRLGTYTAVQFVYDTGIR